MESMHSQVPDVCLALGVKKENTALDSLGVNMTKDLIKQFFFLIFNSFRSEAPYKQHKKNVIL